METELGVELEIAGVDVDCLFRDLDDVESAVRTLSLYHQFSERFSDAFHCIDNAMSYWLEDGRYADCAESTTTKMFHLRSVIDQHVCFSEATSLPRVIRGVLGINHPASDTQLVATYALIQAVEAVTALGNWLFNLELRLYDLDYDLVEQIRLTDATQYASLLKRERERSSELEIEAREEFAIRYGETSKALMLASLYQEADHTDNLRNDLSASRFLRTALDQAFAAKASERAKAAGKANSKPGTAKQEKTKKLFEEVSKSAIKQIAVDPKISAADLVKILVKQGKGSIPTVRKYLKKGGFLPR